MRCADLIHIDLPWNPSRIEQRNGRIDRKLQPEPEVRCRYFVYCQRPEDIVLKALVEKTTTIREQLGASGQVLEARITERLERDGIETHNAKGQAELIRNENDAERQRRATEDMDDETASRRKRLETELEGLRSDLDKSRKTVGINSGELQHVTAIALSRFGVDMTTTRKVRGKNIAGPRRTEEGGHAGRRPLRSRHRVAAARAASWSRRLFAGPERAQSGRNPPDAG